MLKVKNITKYYGDLKAVDKLSFEIKEGDIFGLLGVNGAGKTTTFRMIMGLLEFNSGEITWNGKKIDYNVTDNIGFLTEERSLLLKMTVKEQVEFYGTLKGMTKENINKELDYWLNRFEISEYKYRKIKELSKGNQQKIQFITAIINNPKLLILDEPFTGLDPLNVEMFKKVIKEFQERKAMIIFSSHRMEHVELFCEKLVVLLKGKTVLEGKLKDIKKKYSKKNIIVKGDINKDKLTALEGIISVKEKNGEFEIKIKNEEYINNVFKYISNQSNITKFIVEEPSLNEIFVSKVGESYE